MSKLMLPPLTIAALAFAQPALSAPPPEGAMAVSEIIRSLEDGGDVAYFDEIEWDSDGYWEIEYYRVDGGKVEIKIDPVSDEPRQ